MFICDFEQVKVRESPPHQGSWLQRRGPTGCAQVPVDECAGFQLTSRLFTTCRSRPSGRRRHVPALHRVAPSTARRAGGRQAAEREIACYVLSDPCVGCAMCV